MFCGRHHYISVTPNNFSKPSTWVCHLLSKILLLILHFQMQILQYLSSHVPLLGSLKISIYFLQCHCKRCMWICCKTNWIKHLKLAAVQRFFFFFMMCLLPFPRNTEIHFSWNYLEEGIKSWLDVKWSSLVERIYPEKALSSQGSFVQSSYL